MNYYDNIKLDIYEAYDNGEISYNEKEYLLEEVNEVIYEDAANRFGYNRLSDRGYPREIKKLMNQYHISPRNMLKVIMDMGYKNPEDVPASRYREIVRKASGGRIDNVTDFGKFSNEVNKIMGESVFNSLLDDIYK